MPLAGSVVAAALQLPGVCVRARSEHVSAGPRGLPIRCSHAGRERQQAVAVLTHPFPARRIVETYEYSFSASQPSRCLERCPFPILHG